MNVPAPKDPELNEVANYWLKLELPDDGEFCRVQADRFDKTNPAQHVRNFFVRGNSSFDRFGVHFRFGGGKRQWWVAYTKSLQTAVRLADIFTLHFWYTRVRNSQEPTPSTFRFNLSISQAEEDLKNPDIHHWLERLEDVFVARGVIRSPGVPVSRPPANKRVSRSSQNDEILRSTAGIVVDIKQQLRTVTNDLAEIKKKLT